MLPDGNGVDFIRELRKADPTRDVPILLISPLAGSALELAGTTLGRVEYFDKPIDLAKLASSARAAVGGSSPALKGATP
jgi:DNA-binding response OmpR family regulator